MRVNWITAYPPQAAPKKAAFLFGADDETGRHGGPKHRLLRVRIPLRAPGFAQVSVWIRSGEVISPRQRSGGFISPSGGPGPHGRVNPPLPPRTDVQPVFPLWRNWRDATVSEAVLHGGSNPPSGTKFTFCPRKGAACSRRVRGQGSGAAPGRGQNCSSRPSDAIGRRARARSWLLEVRILSWAPEEWPSGKASGC